MNRKILTSLIIGAFLLCTSATALAIPAIEWPGNPQGLANDSQYLGFEFSTTLDVSVTALGAFDSYGDGFGDGHMIGLLDSSLNLLASTIISAGGGTLEQHFRYQDIAPVGLSAGNSYYVVASGWGGDDEYAWSANMGIVSAPGISYDSSAWSATPALSMSTSSAYDGWFGANAKVSVPEPATMLLLGTGLLGLAVAGRKKFFKK